jgi:hypothetical protein
MFAEGFESHYITGSIILIPSYHGATEVEIEGEVNIIIYFYYVISVMSDMTDRSIS